MHAAEPIIRSTTDVSTVEVGDLPDFNQAKRTLSEKDKIDTEIHATGCVRQKTAGRGAYELMSPIVLEQDAQLLEWGAEHRGHRNWEKGMPFSRCIQSIYRHVVKFQMRERDEDHDNNLAAIRFQCMCMMHYEHQIKRGLLPADLDDRPDYRALKDREGDTDEGEAVVKKQILTPGERLRFYVAGPISSDSAVMQAQNFRIGRNFSHALEQQGHMVFSPFNYESDMEGEAYERVLQLDISLINKWATALFFIGSSPGADREKAAAEEKGIPIFTGLDVTRAYADAHYAMPA